MGSKATPNQTLEQTGADLSCAYLNWKGRLIQVILDRAPPLFVRALKWMQVHFDEMGYTERVVVLKELTEEVGSARVSQLSH